ncbi:MAG: DNA alkylation repair protein [Patescibacteria group bacterium]|jgi:3-methyladenine DNA glycosylase AlkD
MGTYQEFILDYKKLDNPKQANILRGFFKTGKGEYGEGDVFLGIKVPVQRSAVKKYYDLPINDVIRILTNKIHEYRLSALFILVHKFQKGDDALKNQIFNLYLKNTKFINNWDLVDLSAPNIVGNYLLDKPRTILYELAKSKNLWERRISVLSTFTFIRQNDFKDTLRISGILLNDKHDLIHKAVGWMLREIGKRNKKIEENFLKKYYRQMPRTMLRYAIERFPKAKQQKYLKKD